MEEGVKKHKTQQSKTPNYKSDYAAFNYKRLIKSFIYEKADTSG